MKKICYWLSIAVIITGPFVLIFCGMLSNYDGWKYSRPCRLIEKYTTEHGGKYGGKDLYFWVQWQDREKEKSFFQVSPQTWFTSNPGEYMGFQKLTEKWQKVNDWKDEWINWYIPLFFLAVIILVCILMSSIDWSKE